jgi:hypothetical protein
MFMDCIRCGFTLSPEESHEQVGQEGARQHQLERCFELVNGDRNVMRTGLAEAIGIKDRALATLSKVNDPELAQKLDALAAENQELKKQLAATTEGQDVELQNMADANAVKQAEDKSEAEPPADGPASDGQSETEPAPGSNS